MKKSDEFFANNKPKFIIGAVKLEQIPDLRLPEFAFAGRSNVGKSSLINAITKSDIAITSKTPGRTKQLNFFDIAQKMFIVDMPGYGYAKANKKEIENWTDLIIKYLLGRVNLKRVFLLIDSRRGIMDNDLEVMKVLNDCGVLYQIVLTKCDEIKPKALEFLIKQIKDDSVKHTAMFPEIIATSSNQNIGLTDLRDTIYDLVNNTIGKL